MEKLKYILTYLNRYWKGKRILRALRSKHLLQLYIIQGLILSVYILPLYNIVDVRATLPDYWSTNGWQTSKPESQGMSSTKLRGLHKYIQDQNLPLDSVIIVRNGYIVYEDYPSQFYGENGTHILHSVTKSFTSALIGIAIKEGYIDNVYETVLSFFPNHTIANLNAWKQAMTIEHLLNMMTGIEWDEWTYPYTDMRNDLIQMIYSGDCVQFMLDRPMATEPGTVWVYNTGASHLLAAIIKQTTGQTPLQYASDVLFKPLGITKVYWPSDPQGLNYGGSELQLRPRDMAKFGFLYLHNGAWDGKQIIPVWWVDKSRESAVSPWYGTGYGYQWWKDLDLGTYEARGLHNQWIIIDRENNLVIIFTATDINGQINIFSLVSDYILSAIGEFPDDDVITWEMTLSLVLIIGAPIAVIVIYLVRKRNKS